MHCKIFFFASGLPFISHFFTGCRKEVWLPLLEAGEINILPIDAQHRPHRAPECLHLAVEVHQYHTLPTVNTKDKDIYVSYPASMLVKAPVQARSFNLQIKI
tara:strand:- start:771 stop:1076 length:306 start_codon:yes stop_codon:yes gene_type:complete